MCGAAGPLRKLRPSTMKKCSLCLLYFLTQTAVVFPEVLLVLRAEGQSTDFSCPRGGPGVTLMGLRLSRLGPGGPGPRAQHALLSVGEGSGSGPGPDPRLQGRVAVASGGLGAGWVNLTLSGLRRGDSGLYTLELSSSPGAALTCPQVLLMVEGTDEDAESGCDRCCQKYASLIYSIFTATALLLLLLGAGWLARQRWTAGLGRGHKRPPPIYEEMDRKPWRRCTGRRQEDAPGPSHPEETTAFPVYANTGLRHQAEDNYYACPRGVRGDVLLPARHTWADGSDNRKEGGGSG